MLQSHRRLNLLQCRKCAVVFSPGSACRQQRAGLVAAAAGKHYAVVGAGLAGLATAYQLLKQCQAGQAVHVTVVDAVGIGAGGSGAAAGLLHPFTPKGKLLWRAAEAMSAAVELLEAAERAAAQQTGMTKCFAWRRGMLRPVTNVTQSQRYWKLYSQQQQQQQQGQQSPKFMLEAAIADASTAQQLVPGVILPLAQPTAAVKAAQQAATQQEAYEQTPVQWSHTQQQQQAASTQQQKHQAKQHWQQQQQLQRWSPDAAAALHVPGGITLQPLHYMHAVWAACEQVAAARHDGSSIRLHIQQLTSVDELPGPNCANDRWTADGSDRDNNSSGSSAAGSSSSTGSSNIAHDSSSSSSGDRAGYDAVVVAAGAAVGSLNEIGGQLPITLCQGYTLDLVPSCSSDGHQAAAESGGLCSGNNIGHRIDQPPVLSGSASSSNGGVEQTDNVSATSNSCSSRQYSSTAPSLLGDPYLGSMGGQRLVVGATKQHDWTIQQAIAELGCRIDPHTGHLSRQQVQATQQQGHHTLAPEGSLSRREEIAAAAAKLLHGAAAVWPAITSWRVGGIRTGVRALPPRTPQGAIPIAGRWQGNKANDKHSRAPVWLVVGLGARGLVYHAWLGKLLAQAVLSDSEASLPAELLAWRNGQVLGEKV